VGVGLFVYLFGRKLGDYNYSWKNVSFINWIMGYQIGELFPIRKVQQHFHFTDEDTSKSVDEYASS